MIVFLLIAALTLLSAVAAMALRNMVHCALFAALTFGGLAALFLQLDAQFVGFAQILVYVGAVAILIVFAILLTRGSEPSSEPSFSKSWWVGIAVALLVFATLAGAVVSSPNAIKAGQAKPDVHGDVVVQKIGIELMTRYVLPLEIAALLLTASTIGAVIIALHEKEPANE